MYVYRHLLRGDVHCSIITGSPVPTALVILMENEYCVCGSRPVIVAALGTGPLPPSGRITFSDTMVLKFVTEVYDKVTPVISEFPSNPNIHDNEIESEEIPLLLNSFTGAGEPGGNYNRHQASLS